MTERGRLRCVSRQIDQELAYSFGEKVACQNSSNQIITHFPWFYARRNIEFIFSDSGKEQKNLGGQYIYILRERWSVKKKQKKTAGFIDGI